MQWVIPFLNREGQRSVGGSQDVFARLESRRYVELESSAVRVILAKGQASPLRTDEAGIGKVGAPDGACTCTLAA